MNTKYKTEIAQLKQFDTAEWIKWIESDFYHLIITPEINTGDIPFDRKLIWLNNQMQGQPTALDALSDAVVALINQNSSNTQAAELMYYLFQFITYSKPERHSATLERLFTSGKLTSHLYNGINLHYVLLSALLVLSTGPDLTGYFKYQLRNGVIESKLLGLKYYSKCKSSNEYFEYINQMLDSPIPKSEMENFSSAIISSLNQLYFQRKNGHDIFRWWFKTYSSFNQEMSDLLVKYLKKWLHSENPVLKKDLNLYSLLFLVDGSHSASLENCIYLMDGILKHENSYQNDHQIRFEALSAYMSNPQFNFWTSASSPEASNSKTKAMLESPISNRSQRSEVLNVIQAAAQVTGPSNLTPKRIEAFKKELRSTIAF